jgi:hypothetical protein
MASSEAALEGRRVHDRRRSGGAVAGDGHVGRLVHAVGRRQPELDAMVEGELAGRRRLVGLERGLVQEGARGRQAASNWPISRWTALLIAMALGEARLCLPRASST